MRERFVRNFFRAAAGTQSVTIDLSSLTPPPARPRTQEPGQPLPPAHVGVSAAIRHKIQLAIHVDFHPAVPLPSSRPHRSPPRQRTPCRKPRPGTWASRSASRTPPSSHCVPCQRRRSRGETDAQTHHQPYPEQHWPLLGPPVHVLLTAAPHAPSVETVMAVQALAAEKAVWQPASQWP